MSAFFNIVFLLITALLFSLILFSNQPPLFGVLLGVLLIFLSYIDFISFKIPDWINALILLTGIAYNISIEQSSWTPITSFIIAGVFFYSLSFLYSKVRDRQGLGGGDIKLFACGAVWLLPYYLPLVLLISSISALFYAYLSSHRELKIRKKMKKIPYGPFLGLGIWLSWIFGQEILNAFVIFH